MWRQGLTRETAHRRLVREPENVTCLFCHRMYAFLSENSVREIQHNSSKGTKRVSILFPAFPARAGMQILTSQDSSTKAIEFDYNLLNPSIARHQLQQMQNFEIQNLNIGQFLCKNQNKSSLQTNKKTFKKQFFY